MLNIEEIKNQETAAMRKSGTIVICTTLLIGYIIGRVSSGQLVIDSYKKGVSDTLNSIILRH